jgi:hypothetical protein
MIDVIMLLAGGIAVSIIIIMVFQWGYEKEKRGERTDIFGRPNNHMK